MVKTALQEAKHHRQVRKNKARKKFHFCSQKMKQLIDDENNKDIPKDVLEIVSGVNIFTEDLVAEPSADPMICDPNIRLSKNELAFLRRGPRFMVRQELNINDYKTECERMIAIEKYDKIETEVDQDTDPDSPTDEDVTLTKAEKVIMAKSSLVYDKSNKSLDMGRLKATEYKFNKYVHLPKAENVTRESLHEVRRNRMSEIFMKAVGTIEGDDDSKKKVESNLSKQEQEGLKSLQSRVNKKELVVTETDKSRRFCVDSSKV